MMKTTRPVYGCGLARLASLSDTTLVQPLFGGSYRVLGRLKCLEEYHSPLRALPRRPVFRCGWLEIASLSSRSSSSINVFGDECHPSGSPPSTLLCCV